MSVTVVDLADNLLRVGLAIGAVFQLLCIAAAVWVPAKEGENRESGDTNSSDDDVSVEGSRGHVRRGRFERKKRR